MKHHHNIPRVSTDVGRTCLSDLLRSLSYQGHTSLTTSLCALASCTRHLGVPMSPRSSIPNFSHVEEYRAIRCRLILRD